MREEWGPWIEHDGKGCPCVGRYVSVVLEGMPGNCYESEGIAGSGGGLSWDWEWWQKPAPDGLGVVMRIIEYRIRKPRGLTILEEIANGGREPVDA